MGKTLFDPLVMGDRSSVQIFNCFLNTISSLFSTDGFRFLVVCDNLCKLDLAFLFECILSTSPSSNSSISLSMITVSSFDFWLFLFSLVSSICLIALGKKCGSNVLIMLKNQSLSKSVGFNCDISGRYFKALG